MVIFSSRGTRNLFKVFCLGDLRSSKRVVGKNLKPMKDDPDDNKAAGCRPKTHVKRGTIIDNMEECEIGSEV